MGGWVGVVVWVRQQTTDVNRLLARVPQLDELGLLIARGVHDLRHKDVLQRRLPEHGREGQRAQEGECCVAEGCARGFVSGGGSSRGGEGGGGRAVKVVGMCAGRRGAGGGGGLAHFLAACHKPLRRPVLAFREEGGGGGL